MKRIALLGLVTIIVSCNTTKMSTQATEALPPVIVYKTTGDFNNFVPITLNEAKDKIVSYPAPADLYSNGELALPVKLKDGYLLDRRGLNENAAFTSFTYDEYSQMGSAPSLIELMNSITDSDPFEEIYDCGRFRDNENLERDLNKLIRKQFKGCSSLLQ